LSRFFDRFGSLEKNAYGFKGVEKLVGNELRLGFDFGCIPLVSAAPIVESFKGFRPPVWHSAIKQQPAAARGTVASGTDAAFGRHDSGGVGSNTLGLGA